MSYIDQETLITNMWDIYNRIFGETIRWPSPQRISTKYNEQAAHEINKNTDDYIYEGEDEDTALSLQQTEEIQLRNRLKQMSCGTFQSTQQYIYKKMQKVEEEIEKHSPTTAENIATMLKEIFSTPDISGRDVKTLTDETLVLISDKVNGAAQEMEDYLRKHELPLADVKELIKELNKRLNSYFKAPTDKEISAIADLPKTSCNIDSIALNIRFNELKKREEKIFLRTQMRNISSSRVPYKNARASLRKLVKDLSEQLRIMPVTVDTIDTLISKMMIDMNTAGQSTIKTIHDQIAYELLEELEIAVKEYTYAHECQTERELEEQAFNNNDPNGPT